MDARIYGWEMALLSENYLSILSEKMAPHGIERFFNTLTHIYNKAGGITAKEIGELLKRDKVSVMRMIDYLCDNGFVVRKPNPYDRRSQLLDVTQKGKDIIPLIRKAVDETNNELFEAFSEEERSIFIKGMNLLHDKLEQLPEANYVVHATKRKK